MDLFTTYTHHSELQVSTALSLICTLYTSPQHPLSFPACYVLTSCSLATVSNIGDSLASRTQILLSQSPVQNSCQFPAKCQLLNSTTVPSLLSLPCRAQLSTPTLNSLSVISLPSQESLLIPQSSPSARLGSSLYNHGADPTENTVC
jgi:hypothetical protein